MIDRLQENLRISLGLRVRQERQGKGLTLEQLAKKATLSQSYISEVEKGKKSASLDTVV